MWPCFPLDEEVLKCLEFAQIGARNEWIYGRDPRLAFCWLPCLLPALRVCVCVQLYNVCLFRLRNEYYEHQDQEMGVRVGPDGRWTRIRIEARIGTSAN